MFLWMDGRRSDYLKVIKSDSNYASPLVVL